MYGVSDIPLAYDPPVTDPKEIATVDVAAANGIPAYKLQTDPARKLKNFQAIPIAYVTAERSTRHGEPVTAFLKQAGCDATDFSLKDKGILGNGHFMMLETNRKQVFEAINAWIQTKVPAGAAAFRKVGLVGAWTSRTNRRGKTLASASRACAGTRSRGRAIYYLLHASLVAKR